MKKRSVMEGKEKGGAVTKRSVDPKCIPRSFIPGAPCDTSVQDVLCLLSTLGASYTSGQVKVSHTNRIRSHTLVA